MVRLLQFLSVFVLLSLMLWSCSDDDKDQSASQSYYQGYIPSFSVSVPRATAIATGATRAMLVEESSDELTDLQVSDTLAGEPVDCSPQLKRLNLSPHLPTEASSDETSFCRQGSTISYCDNKLGIVHSLYVLAQFYDCNIREQLRTDISAASCRLREGTGGSLEDDDLCDSDATTPTMLLVAKKASVDRGYDRFVGWTMDLADPVESDAIGRMINIYEESGDYQGTTTRVDLKRVDGKRTVDVTIISLENDGSEGDLLQRIYFSEAGSGSTVTDNYIVGRWWHRIYGKVLVIKAHYKAGVGTSIFTHSCSASDYAAAIASTCAIPSAETATYFDTNKSVVVSPPAGILTDPDSSLFEYPAGSPRDLETFLDGQELDDYFDSGSFSPDNN